MTTRYEVKTVKVWEPYSAERQQLKPGVVKIYLKETTETVATFENDLDALAFADLMNSKA